MEKYGFIYVWRDRKKKRYYIGSHWGTEDDGYICSSDSMREAHRRRPKHFRRRVVSKVYTSRVDLLTEEQRWLDMIKPEEFGRRYYNMNAKTHGYYWWVNEETRKIVGANHSAKMKGKKRGPCSPEKAKAISEAKIRKFQDPEYRKLVGEKVAAAQRGKKRKPHTQEWKDNNSKMLREQWKDGTRSREEASKRWRDNNPKHINNML